MNCPQCNNPMRKIHWEVTSNLKDNKERKEYEKFYYNCVDDDIWVTTEIPMTEKPKENLSK